MKRPARKASALRLFGGLTAIALGFGALAGCQEPGAAAPPSPLAPAGTSAPAAPAPTAEIDDTDPEAFDLTESTYWDGRPSLGGLWAAHPLVENPMRVRIVNAETGASADGALFRRDPALPGPPVMLSYDAAKAIGVKPGVVTRIRVVALKDEATLKAEQEARAANAAAPAPAVEITTVAPPAAEPPPPPVAEAPAAAAPTTTEASATAPAAPETAAPAPAAPETAGAPQIAETAEPANAPATPAEAPPPAPTPAAETAETPAESPAAPPVETAVATPAETPAEPPAEALTGATAQPAAAAEEAPARPALRNRFIQIATFRLAASAEKTAAELRAAGLPAEVRSGLVAGEQRMSRVMLGPFDDAEEQSAGMRAARDRGFKDAFYVDK